MTHPFKYVFGPVRSWRLGRSLGVDPLSSKSKICNMDLYLLSIRQNQAFDK